MSYQVINSVFRMPDKTEIYNFYPFVCFKCSETCGVGIQARRLVCSNSKGVTVADGECSNEPRPKLIRSCQNRPCTVWNTSLWSQVWACVVLIFLVFSSYGKIYIYIANQNNNWSPLLLAYYITSCPFDVMLANY